MGKAKNIFVAPILAKVASNFVKKVHYSGKVADYSCLHLGVFVNGGLEGVMQFGSSIDKRKTQGLVKETGWNDFIELNRMAFSEKLPRNSESRALGIAFRLIKKNYPHIEWVISFADATQCGDGTIYRASGFVLTGIKKNKTILKMPSGEIVSDKTLNDAGRIVAHGGKSGWWKTAGATPLPGFQMRYVYFLKKEAISRLTCQVIPFSKIEEMGAGMYKAEKVTRVKEQAAGDQSALGGATPTHTLQFSGASA